MSKKRYQIIDRISEGNFGMVYKALDKETNVLVALKKIIFNSKNKKARSIVEREIDTLKKIDHPNIIKLLDFKIKETKATLVLEYCEYDLMYIIQNSIYPLDNEQIKQYAKMILEGLNQLHSQKIIHRDLKPSNILVNQNNQIKIADFGSSVQIEHENQKFEIEGFTRWLLINKLKGINLQNKYLDYLIMTNQQAIQNYQFKDIWAFGCIYAELIQGFPLFSGNNEIDQISRIAAIIGSPDEKNWPNVVDMPDYGKLLFKYQDPKILQNILPNAINEEIQFLQMILKYQNRSTISELLSSQYFKDIQIQNFQLEFQNRIKNTNILNYMKFL